MSVVMHIAGTATTDALPKIARAFDGLQPRLAAAPALERSELLVNPAERKVQFLLTFASFEDAQAFMKSHAGALLAEFQGLVNDVAGPFFLALDGEVVA